MSYFLLLLYFGILLLIIKRIPFFKSNLYPSYLPGLLFILKFFGGLTVYFVYAYFYGSRMSGDIFKYFDDGNIIFSSFYENPIDYLRMVSGIGSNAPHLEKYYDTCRFWNKDFNYGLINDNRIVIRFNALVRLISMGNFHIHTLLISFLSFTGLWAILKLYLEQFANQKWLLMLVVFFFPSVYFWTSGVLKEGILMFAFGVLLYNLYRITLTKPNFANYIWVCLCLFLLLISKFYVLIAALPGLLFFFLIKRTTKTFFYLKLSASIAVFLLLSWFSKPIIGLSFTEILAKKQHDFVAYVNDLTYVGSKIEIPVLEPTFRNIAKNCPGAFLRTLFKPSVFEINNAMSLMAVFENIIIIAFLLVVLVFFNKKNIKTEGFWFALLFVIILFTLSGLTTPVLGALVRYKAPALPFLGISLMYLTNFEKIKQYMKKAKKL